MLFVEEVFGSLIVVLLVCINKCIVKGDFELYEYISIQRQSIFNILQI